MPNLRTDLAQALAKIDETATEGHVAIDRAANRAREAAAEVAAALPSIPERAADLMERATLACSASFTVDPGRLLYAQDAPMRVRHVEIRMDGPHGNGFAVEMMDTSRDGVAVPAGKYRALLFVLPVADQAT